MATEGTLYFKKLPHSDPRLGRHILHDSRSLRFLAPRRNPRTLKSIRHEVFIPIIDQGSVGSCTGHAGTANICSGKFWTAAKGAVGPGDPHVFAENLYGDATIIDPWSGQWRPEDTGSDGLSIAKVLLARGLISGYQHATSLDAILTALANQVVMIGSSWYEGMYEVDAEGHINVSGMTVGGHEFVLDQLDVERERVWKRGSWFGWGFEGSGRGWMTWTELDKLMRDSGDCTVLVPLTEPAPQPQPVPTPPPAPSPGATLALSAALRRFVPTKQCPAYLKQHATEWLKENP